MRVDVRKLKVIAAVLIAIGVLLFRANPATGTITVTGDVTPAYDGSSDPWNVGGDLIIGNTAAGSMVVNQSMVTSTNGYLAYTAGGTADVVVMGTGIGWNNSGGLYIGGSQTQAGGTAVLTMLDAVSVDTPGGVIIWNSGTVAGDGILRVFGGSPTTNWGTISPGGSNSIGQLTILGGPISFQSTAILVIDVNNSGDSDEFIVGTGGKLTAGGTLRVVPQDTIKGVKEYTFVQSWPVETVTGTFDTPDTALLTVDMVAPPTPQTAVVRVTAGTFDQTVGGTPNQRAFGTALQDIADVGSTAITTGLQQLPTLAAVRDAYDQLSGQNRPPLAPIVTMDSAKFTSIIANRLQGARAGVAKDLRSLSDSPLLAMARPESGIGSPGDHSWDSFLWDLGPESGETADQGWGTWGKVYGVFGDRDTEDGVTGYSYNVFGQTGGIDIEFSNRFTGGATGGYARTQVDYDTLADEADVGTTHLGLYSTYSGDGWYLNSLVTRSWLNVHTERVVDLTGERHEGYFDGREWSGYVELGFDWQPARSWLIQPLTAFQYTRLHLDQYAETGFASALVFEDQQYKSYKLAMGVKVTKELLLDTQGHAAIVQARGRLVHEFNDTLSSVQARFEDVPGIFWTASDNELSRDSVQLGVGAGVRLSKSLRAFVDYDASFSSDDTVHVISGALDYRW